MSRFFFLLSMVLLSPASALAIAQAGFPSQTIWVSAPAIVEGETIVISAIVYNGNSTELHGTLIFSADDARIGAREFELPEGESQIHSIEWRPKKGEYQIKAQIEGTSAQLSQRETPSVLLTVAVPPPPSALQKTISNVANTAATIASSSLPTIFGVATNIFNVIEPFREKGVEHLGNYLEKSRLRSKSDSQGSILGTSTSNVEGFGSVPSNKSNNMLSSFTEAVTAATLFTFKSLALFYPLLALLLFGTLYYFARRVRRPRD